ncbi:hypothetical protein [Pseudomonas sp. BTN1]|uniref:hypothetical protein n=1 Tax=Pseudomonas sp. BTN1 TaxID=1750647 RepID=UPI00093F12A6|nr:hypothetical protein [Pseudomonas sp. BTN1]OKO47353.1 hypothetical protein BMH52_15610 [Pseudomonas sp. BTN1]
MSEVKRISVFIHGPNKKIDMVEAVHLDRVTAERDALQALLTAADERADHNARVSAIAVEDVLLLQKRADVLEVALAGMLFAFDDGVGLDWSEDLLDFARKLTAAKEFKAALKPVEGGGND